MQQKVPVSFYLSFDLSFDPSHPVFFHGMRLSYSVGP